MVQFNELKITADDNYLIIDASVDTAEYYKNVIIQSIVIDSKDTFIVNGPSNNFIYSYTLPEEEFQEVYIDDGTDFVGVQESSTKEYCYVKVSASRKHVRIILNKDNLKVPIADNMFFVYIITSGDPLPETPKELIDPVKVGVAVNLYSVYTEAMKYTKQVPNGCNISRDFIDYILKVKALDVAIKTGNFLVAIEYWNKLFKRRCKC